MRAFFFSLLMLGAMWGYASEAPPECLKKIDFRGVEEELRIFLDIDKKFEFDETQYYWIFDNGQSLKITCLPKKSIYIEDLKLLSVEILVEIYNTEDKGKLEFNISETLAYERLTKAGKKAIFTELHTHTGSLEAPAIDLSKKPHFDTIKGDVLQGVVSFKFSFPYSKLK